MLKNILSTTTLIVLSTSSLSAFEFTGGSIGVDYTTYADIDDISATNLTSEIEFAITPLFSMALSMTSTSYDVNGPYDLTTSSHTLHAIYNVNDALKVGAFVGKEGMFYYDADTYGIEASYDTGTINVAGYLGAGDMVDADISIAGLNAGYAFGNGFSVGAGVQNMKIDDYDYSLTTTSLEAGYAFGNGMSVYAEAGQYGFESGRYSDDQDYVTIGANFAFGPNGGTSFKAPRAMNSLFFMGPV